MTNNPGASDIPEDMVAVPSAEADSADMQVIENESWRSGATVEYQGLRTWEGGRGTKFRAHCVIGPEDPERKQWGVWATADLDRKLSAVPRGEMVFIRYDGMEPHPQLAERSIHRWTVARSRKAPATTPGQPKPPAPLPFLPKK